MPNQGNSLVAAVSSKGVAMAVQTKDTSEIDFLMGSISFGPESPLLRKFSASAGGFLRPATSKSFDAKMLRVEKDIRYEKALDAIMVRVNIRSLLGGSTVSVAAYTDVLASAADLLTTLACASVIPNRSMSKKFKEARAEGTGKTWKAVKEFPKRIKSMADEMERVNTSTFLAPEKAIKRKARGAKMARQKFRDLPSLMRVFGTALERQIEVISLLNADVFPRTPTHEYLMLAVRSWTGKPHDKEVAELLNAAGTILGGKSDFDALALAQSRLRSRKMKRT